MFANFLTFLPKRNCYRIVAVVYVCVCVVVSVRVCVCVSFNSRNCCSKAKIIGPKMTDDFSMCKFALHLHGITFTL